MSTVTPNRPSVTAMDIGKRVAARLLNGAEDPVLRKIEPKGLPQLFGDEDLEMGESSLHTKTCDILLCGLEFHFTGQLACRVFGNLNLYYSDQDPHDFVSPDAMVVRPVQPLAEEISSYQIGKEGPAPLLVAEVLSERTWQQGDLGSKPILYAELGIPEYILVDVIGELLPQKLLLLRLQENGRWSDEQDADGGVTSRLGFRVILDVDGQLRVLDAHTDKRYARPREAQAAADAWAAEIKARRKAEKTARAEAKARQQAEERLRALEEDLARLRQSKRKRKRK